MTIESHGGDQLTNWAATNYAKAVEGLTNITRALYQEKTGGVLDNQAIYRIECEASRKLRELADAWSDAEVK